jgi:hypothetical protein
MTGRIEAKAWHSLQARAALAGLQLMRSDGAAVVTVLIDRQGQPHRVDTLAQIEEAIKVAEFEEVGTC